MKKIFVYITFPGDPSVGMQPEYFKMEIPDFREFKDDYPSKEYETYMEMDRKTLKDFYGQMLDRDCIVEYSFEVEEREKRYEQLAQNYNKNWDHSDFHVIK